MTRIHILSISALAAFASAAYSLLGLVRYGSYKTGIYDLVIFDQVVRSYSNLQPPGSLVKGQWNHVGIPLSIFSDHISPILALISPLYWINDGPETLIISQAALLALASFPLWTYARRAIGVRAAYLITVAYLLSWPIAEAAAFHFHEFAFMPLMTGILIERWQAGKKLHVAAAALALLCVKEDVGFLVCGFGVTLLFYKEWRRIGAALTALGVGYAVIATQIIIPFFGGSPYRYWAYSALGGSVGEAVTSIISHPLATFALIFSSAVKLKTILLLFTPFLLTSFASPLILTALPMLAIRMLATDLPNWWGTKYHYNAAIIMAILMAGIDGGVRIARLLKRNNAWRSRISPMRAWTYAVTVITAATVPFFALGDLLDGNFYKTSARDRAATSAIALVPDGALVESANALGPNLTQHANVVIWRKMPKRAPWIVADIKSPQPIFKSIDDQRRDIASLERCGYQTIFSQEGYLVLHALRSGTAPVLTQPQTCP